MFNPAAPEFDGSFVELHDLISQFYLLIADYLTLPFLRNLS